MVAAALTPESKEIISLSDIPVIDLSWKRDKVRKLMVRAFEEFGFLKLINHGLSKDILDNVEKESNEFFSLPAFEKQMAGPPNPLGYGSKKIGFSGDTGHLEYLIFHANTPSIFQRVSFISKKGPFRFSCVMRDYVDLMRELSCDLLEILGEGLGLQDKRAFSKLVMDCESDSLIRLNRYPSCDDNGEERLENKDDNISRIGFGEHSDPQILTILRSNDVEGLQIQSSMGDGIWIPVKSDPSALFINVGDALQAMTNGRFASVRHRAVVNTEKSRLSTIFFAAPSLQTWISPLPDMVTLENPQRYRPYTWAEYKKIMYSLRLASNRLDLFLLDCKKGRKDLMR